MGHRVMAWRFVGWCGMAGVMALAAACSGPIRMTSVKVPSAVTSSVSDPSVAAARPMPVPPPATPAVAQYREIAGRTRLREQAIGVLTAAASGAAPYTAEERGNAIEALQVVPGRLSSILPQALTDNSPGVRAIAAMTVGKGRLVTLVPQVTPLLSDPSPFVQSAAIYALKRCQQTVDPTPLADMLMSSSPQVRAQAAFILGELGERSALGMLRDAAKQTIKKANASALRLMDLQVAEARVKLGDDSALAEIRTATFPARPEDLEGTALAAQLLGEVQDRASIDRLIYLTAARDDQKQPMPAEVRLAAAGSLAKMGLRQGSFIAFEYRTSDKDPLRAQAAYVFGETRHADNLTVLEGMLSDQVGRVRVAAAASILKIVDSTDGAAAQAGP